MTTCLLVIDIQRDYLPGGAFPLVGAEDAAAAARRVLDACREGGRPVVHLQHVWDAPEATYMRPGTDGVEIHPLVAPQDGEPVLQKSEPNGFAGTTLSEELTGRGIDRLLVVGMATNMCVDSTVRAAVDRGFDVTVVHDACAAPDVEFGSVAVPGSVVHAAFIGSLADGYAEVQSADEASAKA